MRPRKLSLVCLLSAFALGLGAGACFLRERSSSPGGAAAAAPKLQPDEARLVEVFRDAAGAVVNISNNTVRRGFLSLDVEEVPRGTGSGVVWDKKGHIVTNYHVVAGAGSITVTLADGTVWRVTEIAGVYPDMDVAVIRIAGMLPKYHWQLASAADPKGQPIEALLVRPEQPVTLDFASGKVSVGNTCNRMSGGYKPGNRKVTIDKLASTMMACADPKLMALDREIGKRLAGDLALRMAKGEAKQLELKNAAGDVLVFAGVPTAATRYRGQGERVFLEVAAQTKPCSHPLIPGKQCLQVREVKYDDKGLKIGTPGAFEHFYSKIEGYTHEPGVRNAMRSLLKSVGLESALYASAQEFLAAYQPAQPGCLVLDIRMPGMSGLELQQQLNLRGAVIPVIFMTGHGDIPMAVEAMQHGAFDFLQKPFRDQDLLDRIQRAIAKDAEQRQSLGERERIKSHLETLTAREREVLDLLTQGKQNKAIAQDLGVSPRTIEIHRARVMEKMAAQSVAQLVRMMLDLQHAAR